MQRNGDFGSQKGDKRVYGGEPERAVNDCETAFSWVTNEQQLPKASHCVSVHEVYVYVHTHTHSNNNLDWDTLTITGRPVFISMRIVLKTHTHFHMHTCLHGHFTVALASVYFMISCSLWLCVRVSICVCP